MLKEIRKVITLPDGREITLKTGKLAKQAHGSVEVTMGSTHLLATVVSNKDAMEGINFLPLTVDYREKFAADGRYPGGFLKREARPSNHEILIMRLVDRILRPMFPDDYHADVQVMISLNSHDENVMPDCLAALAASAALSVSDIPFNGPISEVRVIRIDNDFIINPTPEQIEKSDIDLIVGASADSVAMVEGEMDEVSEKEMIDAIKFAHEAIKVQCEIQKELESETKSSDKREYSHEKHDDDLKNQVEKETYQKIYDVAKKSLTKEERGLEFSKIKENFKNNLDESFVDENDSLINQYYYLTEKKAVRNLLLDEGMRLDGRKSDEIRDIWCEVDYLKSPHGSAVFTRGETQSLTTVTLGSATDVNRIDGVTEQGSERFYLHYNFPPFSTGEARPIRGTSRREIGHGNLAQRALAKVVPDDTPYTIRIVSDILESNGSSSMATVCAGTLALMDAGINIKKPVSGIAMGLISDGKRYSVLSDILGDEDHLGDMDFKVAGTKDGITSLQMDIKITGITFEIMEQALKQAKDGRVHILDEMNKALSKSRDDVGKHTPKMEKITVEKKDIATVIGKGGATIREIVEKSGAKVDVNDEGEVTVAAPDEDSRNKAMQMIKDLTAKAELNKIYNGKVMKIMEFGAFVNFLGKQDGLVHISELADKRVAKVTDVVKEGDEVKVKVIGFDRGKVKLSIKQAAV